MQCWGKRHSGRVIRLCLDSFAATRNLIKGGGPVQELCDLVKQIWRTAEDAKVVLCPEWVRREENTRADTLSKAWEKWYRLSAAARGLVQSFLEDAPAVYRHARVVNVPFNEIKNVVQHAQSNGLVLCLVHPQWEAQSWWPLVLGARKEVTYLGLAQLALATDDEQHALGDRPRWMLQASVLDFAPAHKQ